MTRQTTIILSSRKPVRPTRLCVGTVNFRQPALWLLRCGLCQLLLGLRRRIRSVVLFDAVPIELSAFDVATLRARPLKRISLVSCRETFLGHLRCGHGESRRGGQQGSEDER